METATPVNERYLTQITELIANLLEVTPEEVEQAASFADDLSVDSFMLIELSAQLEQRFGVEMGQDDLGRMVDLRTTYQLVAEKAGW